MTVREAILPTVFSKAMCKQPRARAVAQPKGAGISQEAGKTWQSLPARRCQQRCTPLDATSEGPRTETAVPSLGQELPSCASPWGAQSGVLGKAFPNQSVLVSTPGMDTLHHAVELMETGEFKPWTHYIDCGFLS